MTSAQTLPSHGVRLRLGIGICGALVSAVLAAGVGEWTTNGPSSSSPSLTGLVLNPQDGKTIYVGCSTGLFKSTNNGENWSSVALSGMPAYPLAAGPTGTVYAGVVSLQPPNETTDVYKSTTGGAHWTSLPRVGGGISLTIDPQTPTTVYRVIVEPGNLHFPVTTAFLDRSTDGGLSWTAIDQALGGRYISAFVIDPVNPATLYAATPADPPAVFKSTDAGSTWTMLSNAPSMQLLVLDPFAPTTLYGAGGWTGAGGASIYRSTDGGKTFLLVNSTSFRLSGLVIDPRHPGRLFAGDTAGQGVLVSTDGAVTWTPINNGLAGGALYVTALAIDSAGTFLHAITEAGGVWDYQIDDPGLLSLNAAHSFTITLAATDQRTGKTGAGVATSMNDHFGYFSLPALTGDAGNPEVFVKILDGTSLNGKYWFFYGGLTDLEYTLTVTEDATGSSKTYTKAAGSACGGFDTEGFTPSSQTADRASRK